MRYEIAPIIALAAALCALDASAQGDEAVFPPTPEGALLPPEAPVSAPQQVAPPAAPGSATAAQCAVAPRGIDLALFAEYAAQANRRSREIDRLNAVMDREGVEFSEERFEAYRARLTGGGILIALGGASMFAAMVTGITLDTTSSASDACDEEYDGSCDGSSDESNGADLLPGLPLGLLFGGIAAVGIGIPLAISGSRGKKRQELLRRKEETLAPYDPQGAYVSFFLDPERGAGGVQLKVAF